MRPIRLTMKGFGTFRELTEIDFSDLELVALVGNTGSGKSTVIDAMTFALYGRVARLEDARLVAPVINSLAPEAQVSLDFEVDAKRYTAVRITRRTPKGATTKEARLEQGEQVLADRAGDMGPIVEQLLGLDFDRFTKIVVLPQGKFATFLHESGSDRQKLLRELLDLGIYQRLGQQARQIAGEAEVKLEALRPMLAEYGVSDAELARITDRVQHLAALRDTVEADVRAWAEEQRNLESRQAELEELSRWVAAVSEVVVPEHAARLGGELTAAEDAAHGAVARAKEADLDAAAADRAGAAGPNAELCQSLLHDHARAAELVVRLADGERQAAEAEIVYQQAQERLDTVEQMVAEADRRGGEARGREDDARRALAEGPERGELSSARAKHAELEGLGRQVAELTSQEGAAAERASKADRDHTAARSRRADAEATVRGLESTRTAEALTAMLTVGDQCPVCRQIVDQLPDHDVGEELKAAACEVTEARRAESVAEAQRDELRRFHQQLVAELDLAVTTRDRLLVQVADLPSGPELDVLEERAERLGAELAEAIAQREAADRDAAELREREDIATVRSRHRQADNDRVALRSARERDRQQHEELVARLESEPAPIELRQMIDRAEILAEEQARAAAAVIRAEAEVDQASAALTELRRQESVARAELGRARDRLAGLEPPALTNRSLTEDWATLAEWAKVQNDELAGRRRQVTESVDLVRGRIVDIERRTRRRCEAHLEPVSESAPGVDGSTADMSGLRDQVREAGATAEADLRQAVRQREQLAKARQEVDVLEESRQVHGELGRHLRSDGFERWLMGEVIEALVARAGARLYELSGGQYSLTAQDTDFKVIDHRNGDELRDPRTLSGGETFLASLSLALGLADSLAEMAPEGSAKLESLFLDEGFGTLDPELLDVVAGAIEELGASGRMVGVVTHIRELGDRMPVRFEVTKGAGTSTVERVES